MCEIVDAGEKKPVRLLDVSSRHELRKGRQEMKDASSGNQNR